MVKDYTVDAFFQEMRRRFDYHGHEEHPEIKEEVQLMKDEQGIPVPVASYLVCEGYACPISPHRLVQSFGITVEDLHTARKKTRQQRPNFNQPIMKALARKGLVPKQNEAGFLFCLDALSKGETRLESISAAYLILHETYQPLTQQGMAAVFGRTETGIRKNYQTLQAKLTPRQKQSLQQISAVLKGYQKDALLHEHRTDKPYDEKRAVYQQWLPLMHKELPKQIVQDALGQELVHHPEAYPPFFGQISKEDAKYYLHALPAPRMKELLQEGPTDPKSIRKRLEYLPLLPDALHECMLNLPAESVKELVYQQLCEISKAAGQDGNHFLVPAARVRDYLKETDLRKLVQTRFERGKPISWLLDAIQVTAQEIPLYLKGIPEQAIQAGLERIARFSSYPEQKINAYFDDLQIRPEKRDAYLKQLERA